ncbi:MAG: hypothetical protein ACLQIQ_11955 [Beijerinckiaceae bacterium]
MGTSGILASLIAAATVVGVATAAAAQVQPDLWEVSASAAASAGLDSPIAPIILGNAFKFAQKRDPDDVRTLLTRLQLMLAYVAVDRFDLFKSVYGTPDMKIDVSKFDQGLKDYIPTLRTLQSAYYNRWLNPRPDDKGLRLLALAYAAQHFAEIEVALRRRIAAEDAMGLADALANRGLVYKKLGNGCQAATDDYKDALNLFDTARLERNAIENTDRAFAVGKVRWNMNEPNIATRSESAVEAFTVASDEPWIPITIIIAARPCAIDAIKKGNLSDAQKYIAVMGSAAFQGDRIHRFMHLTWPCHASLAPTHFWWAFLNETRMNYTRKFQQESGANADKYFNQADAEFKKGLEIALFSEGGASEHFKGWAESYVEFLKDAGHEVEANDFAETIKSFGSADVGSNGPEAWLTLLDCKQKSM